MANNLFNHRCVNCGNTYLCTDIERIFCSSDCDARFKQNKRANKIPKLSEEERREKNQVANAKSYEKYKLYRKDLAKKERKYVDLKSIMYADTFKKYVPNKFKVMRG